MTSVTWQIHISQQPLLNENKSIVKFEFGNVSIPASLLANQSIVNISKVNWPNFPSTITLIKDSEILGTEIASIDLFVENTIDHSIYSYNNVDKIDWGKVADHMGKHCTIYIKVLDNKGDSYIAGMASFESTLIYANHFIGSSFVGAARVVLNNLSNNHTNDEQKVHISDIITFDRSATICPVYLSSETAQYLLDQDLGFDIEPDVEVHLLIKNDNGALRKLSYQKGHKITLKELLKDHVEETTIYFSMGMPESPHSRRAILTISDQYNLFAVQPSILWDEVGMLYDQINYKTLTYEAANIDLVWGDIHLTLTKNAEGDYYSKQRIGKSKWTDAYHKKPNILIGNNIYLDSLSFNMSIATQHLDTTNKITIKNIASHDFESDLKLNLPDTMDTMSESSYKSVITLDSNNLTGTTNKSISVEFQIFDDGPSSKEKKYQLHWGNIDTTLFIKKKHNYSESFSVGLAEMINLLAKEPVLTSSQAGVLEAFSYRLVHSRDDKVIQEATIKTNLNDPEIFKEHIKSFDVEDKLQFGDRISLHTFSGAGIGSRDKILVDLLIDKITEQTEKDALNATNSFLSWGQHKLKVTQLGSTSPKKKIQDQVIDRLSLLKNMDQQILFNRLGRDEQIVSAEWFINDKLSKNDDCKGGKKWRACFSQHLLKARAGDFVSIFMRTSKGMGLVCQFYLDRIANDDFISFGDSQFDSLLFKYAVTSYTKLSNPQYKYDFNWGSTTIPLELMGNPRVYGGSLNIKEQEFIDLLNEKIHIKSSDGEVISVQHAYLIVRRIQNSETNKNWTTFDFDCEFLDCALNILDAKKVIAELDNQVYSVRVFIDQHDQSEEFIKVSFIDLIIENESNTWIPKYWINKLQDLETFDFQFTYQDKDKTLIKLDRKNSKYQWIIDKYKDDPTVELLDMPGFKTVQRTVYTKNDWGNSEEIRTTEVLSKDYTNAYTLYEFHDFASTEVNLYWKGYKALYGVLSYCRDDFICADGTLELKIGDEFMEIIRGDLIVLPESGPGYKFIFDDINSMEIVTALKDIPFHTNLFFEHLIIKNQRGELIRLPMQFAFHLE